MELKDNNFTAQATEERKNRFSGESYMLTKEEADRHDCIFLAEHMAEMHTDPDTKDKHYKIMRKHLDWFRQHNAEAYMVLLDQNQPFCHGPTGHGAHIMDPYPISIQ